MFWALLASAAVVAGAPFIGQIRAAIQSALPGQYRLVVGGLVAAAVVGAAVTAVVRIRDRRLLRYGWLFAALLLGVVFGAATRTGNLDVDLVEHFHFVEYGLLTWLYYRVWRASDDAATLVLPMAAGLLTGIADEGFQWFVPGRVGELRDVVLNGASIVCGLLFSLALSPPRGLEWPSHRSTRITLAALSGATLLAGGLFVQTVHLGHSVEDGSSRFLSTFTKQELIADSAERAHRWSRDPPTAVRRLSREDHYLEEGLWHVQRRNVANAANDFRTAWRENLIAEKFFAPVLAFPTYAGSTRWPDAQRDVAAQSADDGEAFVSDANPLPIYVFGPMRLWAVVISLAALVVVLSLGPWRRYDP